MLHTHVNQLLPLLLAAAATIPALAADSDGLLRSPVPDHWSYTPAAEQTLPTADRWWSDFHDPTLDSLIALGETNNYNLAMAERRVAIARQAVRSARAGWMPTIGATAGWSRAKELGTPPAGAWSLGLQASWEVDVFGKVYSRVKQQNALLEGTRAEYTAAMISLCSEIASTYFNLRTAQAQQVVARQHIASQDSVAGKAQARFDAGLASKLDVAQALSVLYSTEASLPSLDTEIATYTNAIATLCGVYPSEIEPLLAPRTAMQPDCSRLVAAGVPAELLRRRPDIIEAESTVAAAAAALGVSKKDYLPSLAITGAIGTSAVKAGDLFGKGSMTWSVAPTLSWTIFDGLAREASIASARETLESDIDNYNAVVLNAVQEVENALTTYTNDMKQISILEKVVEQSRISVDLSVEQYTQGLAPFTNVMNAQLDYLQYANSLLSARGSALVALANLYRALGGGTEN